MFTSSTSTASAQGPHLHEAKDAGGLAHHVVLGHVLQFTQHRVQVGGRCVAQSDGTALGMEQHQQHDYYLTTETFIPRDEKAALGIPELICKLSGLRAPVFQCFPQCTQNAYGDNNNKCISNAFLSMLRMYMGLIIINAFLMHSSAYSECEMGLIIINAFLMHSSACSECIWG